MAMMYSVFLGLIAALFLDVFVLNVNACEVKRIAKTKDSKSSVTENCSNGYVAVACSCSGSCKEVYMDRVDKCKAKKIENRHSTTLTLTCLEDDEDNYYTATSRCTNQDDKIISCFLKGTTAGEYGAETRITTNSNNRQKCVLSGNCDSCSIQVLCKKGRGSSGGGGGSSSGGGGSSSGGGGSS